MFAQRSHAAMLLLALALCGPAYAGDADNVDVESVDADSVVALLELVIEVDADTARNCLGVLAEKIQTRELPAEQVKRLRPRLEPVLAGIFERGPEHPLHFEAALLAVSWGDAPATESVRRVLRGPSQDGTRRRRAVESLVAAGDRKVLDDVAALLAPESKTPAELQSAALAALGRLEDDRVAGVVLASYPRLSPDLQPKAVGLLTQRTAWSKALLAAIGDDGLPASTLNAGQVAGLLARGDEELTRLVAAKWGTVRAERNPQREAVVAEMRDFLQRSAGDPLVGRQVFAKVCGQCHKLHGEGQEVGPDITANGRSSYEQLLSNVFDPSLVIGAAYQARTLVTEDGRVLTGLLAEDNEQRIVLKTQGGKLETIPRGEIELLKVSELSLMPEGLERQLKPEELADLFAFLVLDGPPEAADTRRIPGAPAPR
jgi:putative heme-binding domain-containing protein